MKFVVYRAFTDRFVQQSHIKVEAKINKTLCISYLFYYLNGKTLDILDLI